MSKTTKLCNFAHNGVTVASLTWGESRGGNGYGLVFLKLEKLLPLVVEMTDRCETMLRCYGVPFDDVEHPPYLSLNIIHEVARKKRLKLGHVWSKDDPLGKIVYGMMLYCTEISELWLEPRCHLSEKEA